MTTEKNAETGPVDLSGFLPTDETTLEILTADGRPTGWKIRLGACRNRSTAWVMRTIACRPGWTLFSMLSCALNAR